MNEVEQICDRIAIIDKGQLVACGTEQELVSLVTDYKCFKLKTRIPSDFDEKQFIKNIVNLPHPFMRPAVSGDIIQIETTLECSEFF